jgi:hypothetical protein
MVYLLQDLNKILKKSHPYPIEIPSKIHKKKGKDNQPSLPSS